MTSAVAAAVPAARGRPRRGRRGEMITIALAVWTMVGVFLDGWAHSRYEIIETFFTPWHAIFYTGFLAMAVWIVSAVIRHHRPGRPWPEAVPAGYGLALVGLIIFGAGALGDFFWHEVFGAEVDGERLATFDPKLRQFLPTLLSVTLAPAVVMLRRWRIPFGSVTILFTTVVAWMNSLTEFRMPEVIAVAAAAGLAADGLVALFRPSAAAPTAFRAFATATPAILRGCIRSSPIGGGAGGLAGAVAGRRLPDCGKRPRAEPGHGAGPACRDY